MNTAKTYDEAFEFRASNGAASICGLRVYLPPHGMPLLLISELEINRGMSVTNAIETIVKYAIRRCGLSGYKTVLIVEHYPERPFPSVTYPESFACVKFAIAGRVARPTWTNLTKAEFEELLGMPWQTEAFEAGPLKGGARCRRCDRILKDAESISLGIGPECVVIERLEILAGNPPAHIAHITRPESAGVS